MSKRNSRLTTWRTMVRFVVAAPVAATAILSGCSESSTSDAPDAEVLVSELKRIRPDAQTGTPHATPVPNLIGLDMGGGNVVYGTADGKHLIAGDLYALESSLVNLTEKRRETQRKALLADADVSKMIVFPAENPRAMVNVFTDVDCGHCRQMHGEMAAINELGIEVRYLAYPRAGPESPSYSRMVSAWCADNRHRALTTLKQGDSIPELACANPVAEHYELAKEMNLPGTPGIITSEGRLVRGYVSARDLATSLSL